MDIEQELVTLRRMTAGQLRQRYGQLFGEASRSSHKAYLIRKIAWRLQAQVEGDLSLRARRRAAELANDADIRQTPPRHQPLPQLSGVTVTLEVDASHDARLPTPGTALIRHYKGRTIEVLVLKEGFEFNGERYKSLSAVAKAITGSHCNGYRFFQLGENE